MIYSTCPTCGFFIGNVIHEFEEKKEKICSNSKLSDKDQQTQISQLLTEVKVRRYCCRMRLMTCKDLVKEIIAPIKN